MNPILSKFTGSNYYVDMFGMISVDYQVPICLLVSNWQLTLSDVLNLGFKFDPLSTASGGSRGGPQGAMAPPQTIVNFFFTLSDTNHW